LEGREGGVRIVMGEALHLRVVAVIEEGNAAGGRLQVHTREGIARDRW
jgi:hypothetical protein